MTQDGTEMKSLDKKLVEAYELKAFLTAIEAIKKISDDGRCPYPELVSKGYDLAIKEIWEMVKYLEDDDLGL